MTSSSLSSFSRYLVFSKIPRNTFSWQSMLAMIPTAISFTLVPGKEYRLKEGENKEREGERRALVNQLKACYERLKNVSKSAA